MVLYIWLIRIAPALFLGILVFGASAGTLGGTETSPATAGSAEIELRKSFRSFRRVSRQIPRTEKRSSPEDDPRIPDDAGGNLPPQLGALAEALGEQLQSSGTLHLPDVDGGEIVLQGSITPILQTTTGRHLIIDRDRTVDPDSVAGLSRRWPGFVVVQPPTGANLRDVTGSILDAAGYDSVLRAAPLIFGRGVSLRLTPDFVVLRNEGDLLAGETRAISVLDSADALPSELRELAVEYRVRIIELTPDGSSAGVDRAPWRDPSGRVTTIEATRMAPIIEEIASGLDFSVERRVPFQAEAGEPGFSADLRISRDEVATYVFERLDPRSREILISKGDTAIMLNSVADLTAAIGTLLKLFNFAAIGPAVEFYRASTPGAKCRFMISVPGWLTESGGRRLLITGSTVPPLVRLFLTREGIDIFEYRVRGGR